MKKVCIYCGKEFEALRASRKYCSIKCFQKATKTSTKISKTAEERIIIKLKSNSEIVITVLADAHGNIDYIKWFVDEVRKHDNWYVIINGDLWDADQYSSHPTLEVKSLRDSVQEVKNALLPIANKIIGFVWGNHEERCFRGASGKGTMPSYFDIFFEAIKSKNPNFQFAEPMQSFIVDVIVKDKSWKVLFKHGKSSGKNFGILEFRDINDVNEKFDVIVLSHLHLPLYLPVKLRSATSIEEEEKNGESRIVHYVRTTSGVASIPYQDKGNMYVALLGMTRLHFNSGFKVKLF